MCTLLICPVHGRCHFFHSGRGGGDLKVIEIFKFVQPQNVTDFISSVIYKGGGFRNFPDSKSGGLGTDDFWMDIAKTKESFFVTVSEIAGDYHPFHLWGAFMVFNHLNRLSSTIKTIPI